jgi:mRNA interferase MazF
MAMVGNIQARRGDVFLVGLDPTKGSEIQKTRPCVIISPDELNEHLSTYIVAPMTTGGHAYPFRVQCRFKGKQGRVVLDQLRAVDRQRLVRPLGRMTPDVMEILLSALRDMFAA